MKKQKLNFINFGHALGRAEMKKLMAGSKGGCIYYPGCTYQCCTDNGDGTCRCSTCCIA